MNNNVLCESVFVLFFIIFSWQHKENTANELDPQHHDVAVLITRKNICGNNCM